MSRQAPRFLVILLGLSVLSGCGSVGNSNPGGSSGVVANVSVTSIPPSVAVSGTEQFAAVAKDSSGGVVSGTQFSWASSDPAVATINSGTGSAMAMLPGTTQITASANGIKSAPVTLTVTPGFLSTDNLNSARFNATATTLNNGMVLIAGGYNSTGALASVELYNPATGTFAYTGSLNTARYFAAAALLNNGMVLVAGGYNASNTFLSSAELYDPSTGTFTLTGSLITPRRLFVAQPLPDGTVLIAGGYGANDIALASAELYDPTTGTFAPTGNMNVARRITTGTLLTNGLVLIAGGLNSTGAISSAELYDPETGSFTLTGNMNAARYYHTASLLNNGMVLVAGGAVPNGSEVTPLSSTELYNPATGTFSPTGALNNARLDARAILLSNGTVLIAGGQGMVNSALGPLSSAELYDPAAATFTSTGPMSAAALAQTATLLANGDVLVSGGDGGNGTALAQAELYEPGTLVPAGLQSISIAPANPTVSPGAYQHYTASGQFADGTTRQLSGVAWSTSNVGTAQISNDGTNPGAGVAVGSDTVPATVTASAGGVTGTAALNVRSEGCVRTGNMNVAREDFQAIRLRNGKVLVVNGDVTPGGPAPGELFDPETGQFTFTGSPLTARYFFTATLLENGKVLIVGGTFESTVWASAELYDPETGIFSPTGSLSSARYGHTATLLRNGQVLIAGGRVSDNAPLTSAELYDPVSGTFSVTGDLNIARAGHTATSLPDGTVLLAGGQGANGTFPGPAELYSPMTGSFVTTGSMNVTRMYHTATRLRNGNVLIAGGNDNSGYIASAELYDPAAQSFSATGDLNTGRAFHTATLLNGGKVLVVGGIDPGGNVLASTELYDPLTASFIQAGNLSIARQAHTATRLDSGMVLIAGGANQTVLFSAAEIF